MQRSSPPDAPVSILWGFLAAATTLAALALYRGFAGDDTYIHLQYARNLATGHGFSFTPGEPSYGSTSPLWTFVIAAVGRALDGDFYRGAKLASTISTLAAVLFFFLLARRILTSKLLVVCASFAFACDPWLLKWGPSGMETSLGVAFALGATLAYEAARGNARFPFWATLLGLGVLVRPELVGLFLVLLVDRHAFARRPLRELRAEALAFVVPVLPWLVFALATFGDPIPATVHAKSGHLGVGDAIMRTIKIVGATYAPAALAAVIGTIVLLRREGWTAVRAWLRAHTATWGWALGLPVAYVLTRSYVASRYLLVCTPALVLFGFAALGAASSRRVRLLAPTLALALVVASVIVQASVVYPRTRVSRGVDENLIRLGDWLRTNTSPDALVATHEVGAIGYFAHRAILDTAGLVSADALPYVKEGRVPDLLRSRQPQYYVSSGDERTDRQVFEPYQDRMTLLYEVLVQRGGSSERFAAPQRMGVYRFDWSR